MIDNQSTISGQGIQGGTIKIDPTTEKQEINIVSFNTFMYDWTINLFYNKSGNVQEDNIHVPNFITYEENMASFTTFTYGTIKENKVNINLNISNLTSSYFTYTNFTFTSKSTGLNISRDKNITNNGNYEFNDIPLIEGRLYDVLMVEITVKDHYSTTSYSQSLEKIVIPPNIINFNETINDTTGEIVLTWDIKDNQNLFKTLTLYDEDKKEDIRDLSTTEISEKKMSFIGLKGGIDLKLSIKGKWTSGSDNGTSTSNIISFTTIWVHETAPVINSFEVLNINAKTVDLQWNIIDLDKNIIKIYLYDEASKTKIHEMTESEIADSKATISGLTPETSYSWTLRVVWEDRHYGGENEISSETITFTTLAVTTVIPTIDSFTYNNLTPMGVNVNWTITDNDNILSSLYLYDLNNNEIFMMGLEDLPGTIFLDNLTQGKEYNLELRGKWINTSSSGTITSDNNIVFTIPYEHKIAPIIESFNISNITTETVLVSWNYTDIDNVIDSGKIFDETNHKNIYILNKEDLKKGSITINVEKMDKLQVWSLKLNWTDPFYESNVVTSEIKKFEIPKFVPDKKFSFWPFILLLIFIIFILIMMILYIFTNSTKNKWL